MVVVRGAEARVGWEIIVIIIMRNRAILKCLTDVYIQFPVKCTWRDVHLLFARRPAATRDSFFFFKKKEKKNTEKKKS